MTDLILPAQGAVPWGEALFLGNYESNTPEWHQFRSGANIGGSEVSTICGVNPWESPFSLWAKKTGKIADSFTGNEATEWGSLLEPVIIDKFAREHKDLWIYRSPGTFRHKDRDWQIANPDGIYKNEAGEFGIIEIKTARYEDDWLNGVPAYYRTQVQWYMQTFGFKHAYVAVLFSGSKYREFELHADNFEQSINLAQVEHFRELILTEQQPEFDGAMSTYETVRALNPDIVDDVTELGDIGVAYLAAVEAADSTNKILTRMKSEVLGAMGKSKRGLIDGVWRVTRQGRSGSAPYLVNKKG